MLLGIDVGGTHTDAVVMNGSSVLASAKVLTDHDNLLHSIRTALEAVLADVDPSRVKTLNLSTTLSTNAIVEGKTEDVGVLVSSGPGIDPEFHRIGGQFHVIDGSVDHRGTEIQPLDRDQLADAVQSCRKAGVRVFAAVAKFSTRNPAHEQTMADALAELVGDEGSGFVTRGHSLSGILNFPRRVATAYFNSAVWRTYNDFAWAVEESVDDFGLTADINILKADGGTMPLGQSVHRPVESILSGPAASVMGIIALCDIHEDCAILDIGGTTTDIAVFAEGAPVIEGQGMRVGSYPTLVQSLKIKSIGIGGDSAIRVRSGKVTVGPDRKGPSLATGVKRGGTPTLTDALNVLGIAEFGDVNASRRGIGKLADLWDMRAEALARLAVEYAVETICAAQDDLLHDINAKPVYTILELLKNKTIRPQRFYVMGGPAAGMQDLLAQALGREVRLPEHYSVANAIGAALTRTTVDIELFADTNKGTLFIPNLDIKQEISANYRLEDAEDDAKAALLQHLRDVGAPTPATQPEITESGSFNMVGDSGTMGRTIRVKCQLRPSVTSRAV